MAVEAREIVRRAIGDAAGLTIKAQLRRATANLGYRADAWRVREALYGRAGNWSPAALDDLRRRFTAWSEHEDARSAAARVAAGDANSATSSTLAQRLDAIRAGLADLMRQLDELAAEVGGSKRRQDTP